MRTALRTALGALRLLGSLAGAVLLLVFLAFALLQTGPGRAWVERTVAAAAATENFHMSIEGLSGLVPFRFRVARILLADRGGPFARLDDVFFAMQAAPLLGGRVAIGALAAGDALIVRRPALPVPSKPLAELLRLLHLPLSLTLDRLAIGRLVLGRPLLGENIVAALAGHAAFAGGRGEVALDLHRIDGHTGRLELASALAGAAPRLDLHVAASEPSGRLLDRLLGRSDPLPLALAVDGTGPLGDWHGRFAAAVGTRTRIDARLALAVDQDSGREAGARIAVGVSGTAAVAALMPPKLSEILGDPIAFSLHATKAAAGLRLDRLRIATATGEMTGRGSMAPAADGNTIAARLAADVPQLARLGGAFGVRATGAARLAATVGGTIERPALDLHLSARDLALYRPGAPPVAVAKLSLRARGKKRGASRFAAAVEGTAEGVRTGLPAVDALLAGRLAVTGAMHEGPAGAFYLDRLALADADAELSGSARVAPAGAHLGADLELVVSNLAPLGPVVGGKLAGMVTATAHLAGSWGRLRLDADGLVRHLAFDGAGLDRLQLAASVPDLALPSATLEGEFSSRSIAGAMTLAANLDGSELSLSRLHLAAGGGVIDGALEVSLATGLVDGRLTGGIPNLAAWSRFAGRPLAGNARLTARLTARDGQELDLLVSGSGLGFGAGDSRLAADAAQLEARLADLHRAPSGNGRLRLTGMRLGRLGLAAADLGFDSLRPGRFAFRGDATASALDLAFAGDAGGELGSAPVYGLRLARLDGTAAGERLRLEQPLVVTRHGADLAFSGLALAVGSGRIGGSGSLRGRSVALNATARGLPLAPVGRLLGRPGLAGALGFSANVGGTLAAPRGHFAAAIDGFGLARAGAARLPRLGLSLGGDWDGRRLVLDGGVAGLGGAHIRFSGSLPLLLTPNPFGISMPANGRLALDFGGQGEIGRLADLLPIGEDRLSGRFTAQLSLGGTVARPEAAGRASLTGGRYENFASGAVLTGLSATLTGDRDRLTLASLSAGDGAGGKISGEGSIALAGTPSTNLAVSLDDFRIAARDEAVVTASGRMTLAGPLDALAVTAPLTIDRADINLPNRLPPEIVVLDVVRTGDKAGREVAPAPATIVMPARLDITLDMPGRIFVRGHGLESEWRGRLRITGSTAAPRIAGTLVAVRGSFSLLGKSFQLTRGRIVFDGGSKPDPVLDITAEVVAADITAEIRIGGLASAPKITLASTPQLPQDEILSRVLFNQGKGQISAAQGLELAQAAAALTGQDFAVLDRLRGSLGLDWLGFGSGPQGAAPSIVNPNPNASAQLNGTSNVVSAGKYIARGVSVGVTQGVSPPTSKVVVEIQLGRHLTVSTSAGQNGGTGIGVNYNFDY